MKMVVIGAGAAGLMAIGASKIRDAVLLDRNEKAGKKLYITGKGRCNVTNNCAPREFLDSVVTNAKFLYGAINKFSPQDTIALLESFGVPTTTERGNRVFPSSNKSSDVIRALTKFATSSGAEIVYNQDVTAVYPAENGYKVICENAEYFAENVVFACGGKSYSSTGSNGDGYKLAKSLGHTIVTPRAALVAMILKENVSSLMGLSLKNVRATVFAGGKTFSEFGEMLFTDKGVSGPIILSLSSRISAIADGATLVIDLKPALDEATLDKRVLSDFSKYANKQLKNALDDLLPRSMIPYIISASGIDGDTFVNVINKLARAKIVSLLKGLTFSIRALADIESGIVTAGGVSVAEISPQTMESKIAKNCYFVGEMLDVDALTGGFNIQIALSTGFCAGDAINKKSAGEK